MSNQILKLGWRQYISSATNVLYFLHWLLGYWKVVERTIARGHRSTSCAKSNWSSSIVTNQPTRRNLPLFTTHLNLIKINGKQWGRGDHGCWEGNDLEVVWYELLEKIIHVLIALYILGKRSWFIPQFWDLKLIYLYLKNCS